ncbi:MAG TPA: hypothetical protein IAA05_14930 [Candidatus Blautia excrementipullorum]|nr:hypothetical protein [Candidatus Blautia excrementipullorum]
MNGFIFSYPTKVYFGEGVAKKMLDRDEIYGILMDWIVCRKDKERRR